MVPVVLAAGYATRLYPLTENFPKPLLKVGEKTILDHLLDDINRAEGITKRVVISNHRFTEHFEKWAKQKDYAVSVLDDGTSTNETRLGAVKDILFAVEKEGLDEDLLIVAGDNVLDFSLLDLIRYANAKKTSCIMRFYQPDEARLHKTGVAQVDASDRIIDMEEKPARPKSHWCTPPFYYICRQDIPLIKKAIEDGCGTDAPGSFIAWLCKHAPVHAMEMPGRRYDIGDIKSYEEAQNSYRGITKNATLPVNVPLAGKTILVTGSAGFIGAHVVERLINAVPDVKIIGIDNVNDYYDVTLKEHRLQKNQTLAERKNVPYTFIRMNVADKEGIMRLFAEHHFDVVIHLAAQAGVRYSITNPDAYIESNILGFYSILEAARKYPVRHLVYASSSSVYGDTARIPFSVEDKTDEPVSLYAATKKSDELIAHAYSKLYHIPMTGLRFFTVYGPAGRPDMAYFNFTNTLRRGEKIRIFNYGHCERDFTYVEDVVSGIVRVSARAPETDGKKVPCRVENIGHGSPVSLLDFVSTLGECLKDAGILDKDFSIQDHMELVPMQPGDVERTYADTASLEKDYGYTADTTLKEGLKAFAMWYADFYGTTR